MRAVLGARKERESGKCHILKDVRYIDGEGIVKAVERIEMSTKAKNKSTPHQKMNQPKHEKWSKKRWEGL